MSSLHLSTARITFGLKIHPAPRIRQIIFDLLNRDTDWIRKNDTKINQIKNQKTPERQKSSTVIEGQEIETLGKELNIDETTFKQNNSMGMGIENDQQVSNLCGRSLNK